MFDLLKIHLTLAGSGGNGRLAGEVGCSAEPLPAGQPSHTRSTEQGYDMGVKNCGGYIFP